MASHDLCGLVLPGFCDPEDSIAESAEVINASIADVISGPARMEEEQGTRELLTDRKAASLSIVCGIFPHNFSQFPQIRLTGLAQRGLD